MRILLINDYGFINGGAEQFMVGLSAALRESGDEVQIFTTTAGLDDPARRSFADEVCPGTLSGFRTLVQTANPAAPAALERVLHRFRPDVAHLNLFLTQLSPLILPRLRGVPCVYQVHWQRPWCPTGKRLLPSGQICGQKAGLCCYQNGCLPLRDWLPLMAQLRMLRLWKGAIDCFVAASRFMAERLQKAGYSPVELIPYGVRVQPPRPRLCEAPTLLFAGRLDREKGCALLLAAWQRVAASVPGARLEIAGDGPETLRLCALVETLGIGASVRFHGWLNAPELGALYARAWALAVPSIWEEPFGMVVLEAASFGTPAIVSASGGLAETVVDGETGLCVALDAADAITRLADACVCLLSDRAASQRMGEAARARAQRAYSVEAITTQVRKLYASVTS
jgi:glycosyltransferase involved in cell wall biosynthesis